MDDNRQHSGTERFIVWSITGLLAALVLVGFEWDHYRRALRLNTMPHSTWDRVVIGWLLLAKTLCLSAPFLMGSAVLWQLRWRRGAQGLWLGGVSALLFWLLVDLRVQQITGRHLLSFAGFLLEPDTFRWAAGLASTLPLALLTALFVTAGLLAIHLLCGWFLRRLSARWHGMLRGRGLAICVGCLFILILGIVPAHAFVYCTVAVEQVHQSLPCNPLAFALNQANQDEHDRFRLAVQRELEPDLPGLKDVAPAVDHVINTQPSRPHVVVIVLESLRHDALTARYLPKIAARMNSGLCFERHYAGTNCSHFGIFTLLYARTPMQYAETVSRIEPQTCVSLRGAGYQCNFLTSGAIDYLRMNEFLQKPAFDRVEVCNHQDDWPNDDRVVLRRARQILRSEQPQFLMMFLMSTHFPYRYPPEQERHRPVLPAEQMLQATPGQREEALNRYRNAAAFLDEELDDFLLDLDPAKHVIVLTGDHGESVFDDGTLTHWGRLSEAQMRTPMVVVGSNVPARRIVSATTHADLLPTLLHVLSGKAIRIDASSGRDMLAGPQPDQAWVCTKYPSSHCWDGVLIRGAERLGVKVSADPPWLQVQGMLDDNGRFNPRRRPAVEEAPGWAATLRAEWHKLAPLKAATTIRQAARGGR